MHLKRDALVADFWAKSPREGRPAETLAEHTRAALSILKGFFDRYPWLSDLVDQADLWEILLWSIGLHDLGKVASGFQKAIKNNGRWNRRHEIVSLGFMPSTDSASERFWDLVRLGIASHHKDASVLIERYNIRYSGSDSTILGELIGELESCDIQRLISWVVEEIADWAGLLCIHFSPDASVLPGEITAEKLAQELSRYYSLASRLGDPFGDQALRKTAMVVRGVVEYCDHLASAGGRDVPRLDLPDNSELGRRLPGISRWESHQKQAYLTDGSAYLRAPTGTGKTEAALLWARRQMEHKKHRPSCLVYILPYQASLNAMHRRLEEVLRAEVALLHGRALQALYREYREQESDSTRAEAEAKARMDADFDRLFARPVWVSTIYQILRAAYRLPGYETLWTALAGALIVVDEIHAYEPERLGLLIELLLELKRNWGAEVLFVSATMPPWLAQLVEKAFDCAVVEADEALFSRSIRHRAEVIPGGLLSPEVLKMIASEYRNGGQVLVCTNTVKTSLAVSIMR
ncbi:MAG: CRISPR-associated helicase Cas3' [Bacteroidota bacterium]